jgi:hypothetical protein
MNWRSLFWIVDAAYCRALQHLAIRSWEKLRKRLATCDLAATPTGSVPQRRKML